MESSNWRQQAAIVASAEDWAKAQHCGGDRKSDQGEALHLETSKQRATASGASRVTQVKADAAEPGGSADPALFPLNCWDRSVNDSAMSKMLSEPQPATASTRSPNPKPDTLPPIARLSPSEIESLRSEMQRSSDWMRRELQKG